MAGSSVEAKIMSYFNSGRFEHDHAAEIDAKGRTIAREAGILLSTCIDLAAHTSGLSGIAIAAIGESSVGDVAKKGRVGNKIEYEIDVSVPQQSRPSLVPEKYGSVNDMAALLNNGYSAGGVVDGYWHGNYIHSLTFRSPTNFVENGVADFNAKYGAAYNAIAEIVSDRFY